MSTTRRRTSWIDRLGTRTDRPRTAAAAVAATAGVFSTLWVLRVLVDPVLVLVFVPVTVANAYVATWLVWRLLIPADAWSYRRGLVVGLTIGLLAHATVGFVWAAVTVALEGASASPTDLVTIGAVLSLYSIPLTYGFPIVLSAGVALGLTYCRTVAVERPAARK